MYEAYSTYSRANVEHIMTDGTIIKLLAGWHFVRQHYWHTFCPIYYTGVIANAYLL